MQLYLAIDGGGTGCRAALADSQGRVLARADGGPANIASDPDGAARNVLAVTRAALTAAALTDALPGLTVVMGLAGANVPPALARFRAALPFTAPRILSDATTAVTGALREADGIVVALGTGSVFVRQRGGSLHSIGGHGLILGDEASGAWLGRGLLSASLRAVDGLGPMTPQLQAVLDQLGGMDGVIAFSLSARPADFAAFAPRVVEADDPVAMTLMERAEAEIAAAVGVLQPDPALPVVFSGSLGVRIAGRFADRWDVRPALGSGLDGALWLAMQGPRA